MIIKIAPHLASIGVHKNGTWAAQRIIDTASTEEQVIMKSIDTSMQWLI
jgi:protein JSN1